MNRVAKRAKYMSVVIVVFLLCATVFINDYRKGAHIWVVHPSNRNIYNDGELTVAGSVYSSDGIRLLQSDNNGLTYADSANIRQATLHVIGDRDDNIASGVLSSQKNKLIGYNLLNGVYNSMNTNNKIDLTIHAELSSFAYQALGNHNGAVGIYNYETGEILTMVSKPSFDPYNVPDITQDRYEGVYINRVMNGLYVPGSIMKVVTAYAAIENINDIYQQTFSCNGGMWVDGEWISCNGVHGNQNFGQALANSCNVAFAEISLQLGTELLNSYAKKAGIQTSYRIDGVNSSAGRFDVTNAARVNLAWAGIGQYTTMVNPMQFMLFMGAIANNGILTTPHYLDSNSLLSSIDVVNSNSRIMSESTANQLKSLMRENTRLKYGDSNFPNLELGAKTGTAEVEDDKPHSWFVGFSSNPEIPLAFVTIVENGSGSLSAMSVSTSVLNRATQIYSQ